MPSINVKKEFYDKIVKLDKDVPAYVNEAVKEKLEKETAKNG